MAISNGRTGTGCGTLIGWSLLCGCSLAILFVGGMLGFGALFPASGWLESPTAHGAYIARGTYVLLFGTPASFVIGLVIGATIAAFRS